MDKRIQFTKIRDVKTPNRANLNDAGSDFFVPYFSDKFLKDLKEKNKGNHIAYQMFIDENGKQQLAIILAPHAQVNIPSGIKVNIIDKSTYLEAMNKSGVATKYGLVVGACVVDADYQGEVHLNLINTSNHEVTITSGQKIVQFVHKEWIRTNWMEITNSEYDKIARSDRGEGGFSSSGER